MAEDRIVSASGIRGVVGRGLDPEVVARYAAAFGSFLSRAADGDATGAVFLGRDTRTSGPAFVDAAAAGLRAVGRDVRDGGICPTPSLLLAVGDSDEAAGGLVLTASHNPPAWNGLKLIGPDGLFLSPEEGRAVQERFEEGPDYASWSGLGGRGQGSDWTARHVDRILGLDLVDRDLIAGRGLRVAVDPVGGAGCRALPRLLRRLGCSVSGINLEPTGRFPREPEPTAEHLGDLGEAVRDSGADVGMAVDPDADRLSLVNGDGEAVGEDWTLALAVELVLEHRAGPVVTNLSTSQVVEDAARRHGARTIRAPVGEANVASAMREHDAALGGEGNGGVMLADLHATRDAPLAAALVVQLLAERQRSLGELLAEWPSYHMIRWKGDLPERALEEVYREAEEAAPDDPEVDRQDGLRLAWPEDGRWVHVRPSGTEPVVRIIAEAPEREQAEELVAWARHVLRGGRQTAE